MLFSSVRRRGNRLESFRVACSSEQDGEEHFLLWLSSMLSMHLPVKLAVDSAITAFASPVGVFIQARAPRQIDLADVFAGPTLCHFPCLSCTTRLLCTLARRSSLLSRLYEYFQAQQLGMCPTTLGKHALLFSVCLTAPCITLL
jgi:hypothetical protein